MPIAGTAHPIPATGIPIPAPEPAAAAPALEPARRPPLTVTVAPDPRPSPLVAAFRVLARILAVRLILLLAVLGAGALGVMAMLNPGWATGAVLAAYCALTVIPLVALEIYQRPGA